MALSLTLDMEMPFWACASMSTALHVPEELVIGHSRKPHSVHLLSSLQRGAFKLSFQRDLLCVDTSHMTLIWSCKLRIA